MLYSLKKFDRFLEIGSDEIINRFISIKICQKLKYSFALKYIMKGDCKVVEKNSDLYWIIRVALTYLYLYIKEFNNVWTI